MKYLALLLWVAVVGLVVMPASPTSGQSLAQATARAPSTLKAPYPAPPAATPPPAYPYLPPTTLDPTADLVLAYDAPALVHRGGVAQVRYTVTNLGPGPVRGATLLVVLPPSYYLDNVRAGMGWTCNVQNYAAATLTRPVTVLCQRDNWLLAKVPEDIRLDLTLTTSALDRQFLSIQAAVVSTGVDNTGNWVQYTPGIE